MSPEAPFSIRLALSETTMALLSSARLGVHVLRSVVRRTPATTTLPYLARLQHTSFTESPVWIQKMKERFAALDADKKGTIDKDDLEALATKMANYRKLGSHGAGDARKRYFDTLYAVFDLQGPTTESEFVNIMKAFSSKSDAEMRAQGIADMVFEVIDEDGNGEISYDEFNRFHKTSSVNMPDHMIRYFFDTSDTNGDGVIQRSEFRRSVVKFLLSGEYISVM